MPIVDFQQDPSESFGTGNFRDEKGRVMYLHDPETAALFNKTIPGAPLSKKVADESQDILDSRTQPGASLGARVGMEANAIAQSKLGAPPQGPDLRVAGEGGGPDESSVANPGQALIENLNSVTVPPGTPAEAPGATAAAPGAPEAPAAPPPVAGAPAAAPVPAAGPGAALVQATTDFDNNIAARSKPRDIQMPKPNPTGGLPLAGVRSGEGISIEEGRPVENVVEQLKDEAPVVQHGIDLIRQQGIDKDKAVQAGMRGQMAGQSSLYGQSTDAAFRANAERRKAEEEQAKIQAEIKRNDENLDPERYVKRMSTGKRIAMIILAALNGGFGATIGQKSNGVIDVLNEQINKDFEKQKLEVANRRASLGNDYKRYLDMGLDAKQAEALWRDRASKALFDFHDIESKRNAVKGENQRASELLIQPLQQAFVQRRGDLLKESEAKVKRTRDESVSHEVPPPQILTPQDVLATMQIANQRIANANTADVEAAIGHPVTPEESMRIKNDAADLGKRSAAVEATRSRLNEVARLVGMYQGKKGFEGDPDAGWMGTAKRRELEAAYSWLQRTDVMAMLREPSAELQNRFGKLTERPFFDSDIRFQLNQINNVLKEAERLNHASYGDDVVNFFTRARASSPTPTPTRPGSPAPAAAPARPGATPAQRAAAEAERKKTVEMYNAAGDSAGDLRSE